LCEGRSDESFLRRYDEVLVYVTGAAGSMNSSFGGNSALILGASSGHGAGVAKALARKGMDIFGVHFDLRSTLHNAREVVDQIRALGCEVSFFNLNAANPENRRDVIRQVKERVPAGSYLRVLFHSLAFG